MLKLGFQRPLYLVGWILSEPLILEAAMTRSTECSAEGAWRRTTAGERSAYERRKGQFRDGKFNPASGEIDARGFALRSAVAVGGVAGATGENVLFPPVRHLSEGIRAAELLEVLLVAPS